MRVVLLTLSFLLALCLCGQAYADDFRRHSGRSHHNRVNVYNYDGDRSTYRNYGPISRLRGGSRAVESGGIEGPFKNPDPEEARKPENLTACSYRADGTLFYEREGKVCPYMYVDQNEMRVELRRQEYLRAQNQKRVELRKQQARLKAQTRWFSTTVWKSKLKELGGV